MKTTHEDLCLQPFGAERCTCAEIQQRRGSLNPWADIMTTMEMDRAEHEREHGQTLGAKRVEAESIGHSRDCARWIWADHDLPCDCGLDSGTIKGELG